MKLHVLYDAQGEFPAWHSLSNANVNDVERASAVPLEANALYVFDKGYNDYNWWNAIDEKGGSVCHPLQAQCQCQGGESVGHSRGCSGYGPC